MVIEPKTAATAAAHFDNSNSNSGERDRVRMRGKASERVREGEDGRLTIENGRDKKTKQDKKYRSIEHCESRKPKD